jgi:hypothetical protein
MKLGGGGTGKENDRAPTTSKNITSVKVKDMRMCIELC